MKHKYTDADRDLKTGKLGEAKHFFFPLFLFYLGVKRKDDVALNREIRKTGPGVEKERKYQEKKMQKNFFFLPPMGLLLLKTARKSCSSV